MSNFFDYLDEAKLTPAAEQTGKALEKPSVNVEAGITTPVPNLEEPIEELPAKEVTDFKDLVKPENLKVIKDYAEVRFGEAGKQKKGESNEDYAKRWMTSMRQVEWNTTLNAVPELNWLYNTDKESVLKAAKAHELYETIPDWYEKGGQPGARPFAEAALSAISDPTILVGFGIGATARYKAAREAIRAGLRYRIGAIGAGMGAEAAVGAGESAIQQQRELKLKKTSQTDTINKALDQGLITQKDYDKYKETIEAEKIDLGTVGLSAAINSVFGGLEVTTAFRKPSLTTKQDLEQILKSRIKTPADKATQDLTQRFDSELEETLSQFDIFEGRKVLDELSPQTELTQAEIRKDVNRRAIDVAKYVMLIDPSFRPKEGQKISDAVKDMFMSVDSIDDVVLEASLNKAGLSPTEFAQATRTTVADAASVMQGYSSLARVLKRISTLDPEAEKIVQSMYGRDQEITSAMGMLGTGIKRLERESKALVVSSIATTVRNAYGTTTGITFDAASRILEGTLYGVGKGLQAAKNGTYQKGDFTAGLNSVVRDAFGTLTYLTNAGITAEVTEKILAHNPKIQQELFSALQETGTQQLSRVARMANTFNVAQDVMFRRAVFTASVERQLRRVGLDMYEILANEKNIPADVVKNAADDALKATFSYMPKPKKKGMETVEAGAEGLANQFVRFFESVPGGSLMVTFPRFMTNAMRFQYRYSPIGAASGMQEMMIAAKKFSKEPDAANRLYREGLEKFSKGTVGTAAIYSAYKYRLENQDADWYNIQNEDGSTVDTRAVFPIGPYLAVGDFIAKMKLGKVDEANVTEMMEAIAGMKMPAGAQSSFLNSLPELFAGSEGKEADRFEKAIGTIIGDFAGRFIQPGQPVFAYFDQFDEEAQIARDPNVLTSDDLLTEAATNRIKAKLPELKEELPEALRYLREETPVRTGEFFNMLTGVRVVPSANKIEREFTSLSLDPYTFFGSTGDRTYDRAVIKESGPYIEKFVGKLIDSGRYEKMTPAQRKIAIKNNMTEALSVGRQLAGAELSVSDRSRLNKLEFNRMPQRDRRAINELYALENEGRTMDQDKAYDQVHRYKALLNRYR